MTFERWFSLIVEALSDQVVADLAEGLVRLGGRAVVEEDQRLTTILPAPEDPAGTVEIARAVLQRTAALSGSMRNFHSVGLRLTRAADDAGGRLLGEGTRVAAAGPGSGGGWYGHASPWWGG